MADLVTLDAVRRVLAVKTENTDDDDLLRRYVRDATALVEQYTGRAFVPEWRTRHFDAVGDHITARALDVRDLLDVTALVNGDGTVIPPSQVVLRPSDRWPKIRIQLRASAPTFCYDGDPLDAIQVDGVWGFHEAYDRAWIDTLDSVQDDPLAAGVTSITVQDADGVDERGDSRFPILGCIRLEDEVAQVMAVDTNTNTLTVRRAQLGTVAAQHDQGTTVQRYTPMADVENACLALAVWMYRTKDSLGEKIQFLDGTQVITNEAPPQIRQVLQHYRKLRVG
jgi:hypothetical protein